MVRRDRMYLLTGVVVGVVTVLLAGALVLLFGRGDDEPSVNDAAPTDRPTTERAQSEPSDASVSVDGSVAPPAGSGTPPAADGSGPATSASASADAGSTGSTPTGSTPAGSTPAGSTPTVGDVPTFVGEEGGPGSQPGSFAATFDGSPTAPQAFRPTNWDITVHSRDVGTFDHVEPMAAGHGPDCGGPPLVHEVATYESTVYLCRDHVMTAINAGGYAMIYLTPNEMVDFAEGEVIVRFDVSTLRTSVRDWWDVWFTPYADNLQLPLDLGTDVDATGPPKNSVHVTLGTENQLRAEVYDDFQALTFDSWPEDAVPGDFFTGYETFLEPDAARRDTVEIGLSKNHLRVGMPQYDFWWIDTDIPELSWDRGVIQLGHHSYNPTKDCNVANNPRPPVSQCLPNTWHWDNLTISNAVPFTIVGSDRRVARPTDDTVGLLAPAPDDANLRFAAIGRNLEVRFDGGDWQPATVQATRHVTAEEHFASYWMPIPPGTREVSFRGEPWYADDWQVRDVSVWSEST